MRKKQICEEEKEYRCPYMERCKGEFYHITNENLSSLTNPEHLWYFAKTNTTKTCKIWFNQDSNGKIILHICQPFTRYKTFHELEKNKLISRMKKEFLAQVSKLNSNLKNKIRNIEEKVE